MKLRTALLITLISIISVSFLLPLKVNSQSPIIDNQSLSTNILSAGKEAPAWKLKDVTTDQNISLSKYLGKVVLIQFFVIDSYAYSLNLEDLFELRDYYSTSKLAMVAIDFDPYADSESDLEEYDLNNTIPWPILRDSTAEVAYNYGVEDAPTFFVIDDEGIIRFSKAAMIDCEHFIDIIDEYIPDDGNSGTTSEIWAKYWYIFIIGIAVIIFVSVLMIQRFRVIQHNKKVREEKKEIKQRKQRRRTK